MISFVEPLPIGNAVRVLLAPTAGATRTRVLRKTSDDIANENDPAAALIYEGDDNSIVDTKTLTNGTVYYYRAFDLVGLSWLASPSASATPGESGGMFAPDPLEIVRERLEAGLKVLVGAGVLQHASGYIPCYSAPPQVENIQWPVVSIHLRNDTPAYRGIGEILSPDELNIDGDWDEAEGWLTRVQLDIIAWSLNPDERIALRKALKRLLIGNLPVFADSGMDQVEFSISDTEDFESYNAAVYQAVCNFTCIAPALFVGVQPATDELTVLAVAA